MESSGERQEGSQGAPDEVGSNGKWWEVTGSNGKQWEAVGSMEAMEAIGRSRGGKGQHRTIWESNGKQWKAVSKQFKNIDFRLLASRSRASLEIIKFESIS